MFEFGRKLRIKLFVIISIMVVFGISYIGYTIHNGEKDNDYFENKQLQEIENLLE